MSKSTSAYISLGFRQFKQHKKQKTEICPPFPPPPPLFFLSAALHHFLAGKCNISDKDCSVAICIHKEISLIIITLRLGQPCPDLCPLPDSYVSHLGPLCSQPYGLPVTPWAPPESSVSLHFHSSPNPVMSCLL